MLSILYLKIPMEVPMFMKYLIFKIFPCREAACSESEGSSDEELTGPSVQSQTSAQGPAEDTDDDDEDDEFIGPPLPPGFKDSDDDNDNDDTEEEDTVSILFLFNVLML